jgi:hypothetical protein
MAIRHEFKVHILNTAGIEKARTLAQEFAWFLDEIESLIGTEGREIALVRTKLEEASFFAKKAMASRPENQV